MRWVRRDRHGFRCSGLGQGFGRLRACIPRGSVPTSSFWGRVVQKGEVGKDERGWAPAYPQVLCQPPHSGAVLCRKGRLVQMHVVGRLPTPRFCANLHILGLCRAERGGWYGCTWLTGLRRSSREPQTPERGGWYRCTWLTGLRLSSCEPQTPERGVVQTHVVGRLPTPRFCPNPHLLRPRTAELLGPDVPRPPVLAVNRGEDR